jgi:hypothetical protein
MITLILCSRKRWWSRPLVCMADYVIGRAVARPVGSQ